MTFAVDPDNHIDTVEQAKASTIEGTSKWSCKLSITGRTNLNWPFFLMILLFVLKFDMRMV
jgi:hypothetical protein